MVRSVFHYSPLIYFWLERGIGLSCNLGCLRLDSIERTYCYRMVCLMMHFAERCCSSLLIWIVLPPFNSPRLRMHFAGPHWSLFNVSWCSHINNKQMLVMIFLWTAHTHTRKRPWYFYPKTMTMSSSSILSSTCDRAYPCALGVEDLVIKDAVLDIWWVTRNCARIYSEDYFWSELPPTSTRLMLLFSARPRRPANW